MTRIVHLTDLHFGMERPELVAPLAQAIAATAPDIVVVTGDLSHRARAPQFRAAMTFLQGLGVPVLATPGNHDIPLFNVVARMLGPFRSWRRNVGADLAPGATLDRVRILSANTADPFRWRRGILRQDDLRRIAASLEPGDGRINILACHHPLVEPPGFERGETRGGTAALPSLIRSGVHVVLSGHLHHWTIGLGIAQDRPQPLMFVQTGTALCGRAGETNHGFCVLDLAGPDLAITAWLADATTGHFVAQAPRTFHRDNGAWHLGG